MDEVYVSPKRATQDILADFRNFLYHTWRFLDLPAPTAMQYEIAHWLQHGDGTIKDRLGIMAGRGEGKSWITSAFACWLLLVNPQERILVLSASSDRAKAFLVFCRKLIIEMPMLQHLAPRKDQVDTATGFEVNGATPDHAPSLKCLGVMGSLAGNRATTIICDDVENMKNSLSLDLREKLMYAVLEIESILKKEIDGEQRRIIILGTPQSEDTIYNKFDPTIYRFRIWPARIPTEETSVTYGDRLAPSLYRRMMDGEGALDIYNGRGAPSDPEMFTHEELLKKEMAQGKSMFSLQFMLNTSLSDAERFPLKLADLVLMPVSAVDAPTSVTYGTKQIKDIPMIGLQGDRWVNPSSVAESRRPYTSSMLAIDPSGRGADATAWVVLKQLNGFIYVIDFGSCEGGYDPKTLTHLALIAKKYEVNLVYTESNMGDGMFNSLLSPYLRKIHKCELDEVRNHTRKEDRIIDTLEPVMNQKRLIFDERMVQSYITKTLDSPEDTSMSYNLFYQMTRLTREKNCLKHDDMIDVLAIGVNYWTDAMSISAEDQEARLKAEMEQKELDDFLNNEWTDEHYQLGFSPRSKRKKTRFKW